MVWIAVAAALCGAVGLAFGAHWQSAAVREQGLDSNVSLGNLKTLLRSRRWVIGLLMLGAGTLLNIYALASAPLTVVQPIGAIALVITTIVTARTHHLKMNTATILAITACMIGSIAFVLMAINVTNPNSEATPHQTLIIEMILTVVVIIFAIFGWLGRHKFGPFFYIVGAGVLFGFVAVLVRTIAIALMNLEGTAGLLDLPWLAVLYVAIAGLLGSYFVQNAYSKGPPDLVIAGLTVIDPIIGIAIGISILNELRPQVPPVMGMLMGVAGVLAIVGVVALSKHHPDVLKRKARKSAGGNREH
ncbi:DMT family transporter [Glutamicibacter uratoxydans]|uniref:DMT family transporter n=1 Tax=Glutamicibacter uratoxydans TaxID=43667 RepID=UPI003D6FC504